MTANHLASLIFSVGLEDGGLTGPLPAVLTSTLASPFKQIRGFSLPEQIPIVLCLSAVHLTTGQSSSTKP